MARSDFAGALQALIRGGVEFIVVGGLSAVLNGAPINTFDLDIVPSRDRDNIARLLSILELLDAIYRLQPERRLKPTESHLSSPGHNNLITNCGPLDVLGTIGAGLDYHALLPHSTVMNLGDGMQTRVLNLAKLIEIKESLGSEKDRAVLPLLRRTLVERGGNS